MSPRLPSSRNFRALHLALSSPAPHGSRKQKHLAHLGQSVKGAASPAAAGRDHLRRCLPLPRACSSPSVPQPRHAAAGRDPLHRRLPLPRVRRSTSLPCCCASVLDSSSWHRPAPVRLLLLADAACARLTVEAEPGPRPCGKPKQLRFPQKLRGFRRTSRTIINVDLPDLWS